MRWTPPRYTQPVCGCNPPCLDWVIAEQARRNLDKAARAYDRAAEDDRRARSTYAKHVDVEAAA